jgi:hypothetical protein
LKNKLLCLNVEILKAYDQARRIYSYGISAPTICSSFVTASMIDSINDALRLIEEHDLVEVVVRTSDVNWFCSLDKRIFQSINSYFHITKNSVYYSGAFGPEKIPVFVSTRLPLSAITPASQHRKKALNLSLLSSVAAKALIAEIENLDREMQLAWSRQESLEELDSAIEGLKTASVIAQSSKTDALASEVSAEIKQLIKENEELEHAIESKCEILCKRILGIGVGDSIVTQSHHNNKNQEIQIEYVRYYGGVIYLDGPKILKNGSLGKRRESVHVSLVPENEHQ